jgi:hypothetical protein
MVPAAVAVAPQGTELPSRDFLTTAELQTRVPVTRRTLFAWRQAGWLPVVDTGGGKLLFHWPSVAAALLRQQRGGNSAVATTHN